MKTTITIFILLLLPMFLFSQNKNEYRKYTRYYFDHINWNGEQYENSIKGLEIILEDLEEIDPVLFEILNDDVKKYKRKRMKANRMMALGAAGVIGSIGGLISVSGHENNGRANGLFFIGGLASLVFGIGGGEVKPNSRKFIYNFTQRLNESQSAEKVKFSVRPAIGLGNNSSIGLSFSLKF